MVASVTVVSTSTHVPNQVHEVIKHVPKLQIQEVVRHVPKASESGYGDGEKAPKHDGKMMT